MRAHTTAVKITDGLWAGACRCGFEAGAFPTEAEVRDELDAHEYGQINWRQMQVQLDEELGTEAVEAAMRAGDLGPRAAWLTKPVMSDCGHPAGQVCPECMPF